MISAISFQQVRRLLQISPYTRFSYNSDGTPGRLEAGMSVGDDALDAFQATPDEPVEAGAPMDLGLGQGDGHAPPTALAICGHTDRYQYRN